MTLKYRTCRTRDQIADALGGGALNGLFIPLWNSVGQEKAEQIHAITDAVGKLAEAVGLRTPISQTDIDVLIAHAHNIQGFKNEFPLPEQWTAISLAIRLGLPSDGTHDLEDDFIGALAAWAIALSQPDEGEMTPGEP